MCQCNGKGFTIHGEENALYATKCDCMTDQQRKETAARELEVIKERIQKMRGGGRFGKVAG